MKYLVKGCKTFRQQDVRWGNLGYVKAPYFMSNSGCGATAIADIIVSNPKYKKRTPKTPRAWLIRHGGIANGQGTRWNGIPNCLKAYGFRVKEHQTMDGLWTELSKGNRCGVLLFTKGSRGGVTWTTGGHYVSFTGYMVKNGRHYLYTRDPNGNRKNDGWHCYETTMQGLIFKMWSCYLPTKADKEKETKLKGFDVSYAQNGITQKDFEKAKKAGWDFVILRLGTVLNGSHYTDQEFELKYKKAMASGLKVGIYWYTMARSVADAKKEANYVVKVLKGRKLTYPVFYDIEDARQNDLGKSLNKKMCEAFCKVIEDAGYSAGVYASTNWLTNKIDTISKKYYVWVAQYNSVCTYKGRYEMWQYSSTKEVSGIGKKIDVNISEIKPSVYPVKKSEPKKEEPKKEVKKKKRVYPEIPKKGFFKLGDKGTNVKRLQTLLNKAGFKCGKVDGVYGEKTVSAVKKLQKKYGLKQDGLYGKKTHEALKKALK